MILHRNVSNQVYYLLLFAHVWPAIQSTITVWPFAVNS